MKTNPSPKLLKFSTLALLGIGIAIVLVPHPAYADGIANSLILTENSSTSLTATYNGSTSGVTVVLDGPDAWAVEVSSAAFETFGTNWVEPENSLQVNTVFVSLFDSPFVSVVSDTTGTGAVFPNGTDVVGGVDLNNNLPIDITFFDNAATAEGHTAPDTGSTFGLLSLALAALFGATRFRLP